MVRILHLLSVLALVAATGLLALCARSARRDDAHATVSAAPSVVERFKQAGRASAGNDRRQTPPLVQEAEAFAAYLNPPPAPEPMPSSRLTHQDAVKAQVPKIRPANATPKFKLHGISYRPSKPEESMALVWEPDTGHRWVREGMQLGHVVITEIGGDSLIYTDGRGMREMTLDLGQATAVLARRIQDKPAPKRDERSVRIVSHWAPVRRVRQIPAARAAAKMGVRPQDVSAETR